MGILISLENHFRKARELYQAGDIHPVPATGTFSSPLWSRRPMEHSRSAVVIPFQRR